MPAILNDEQELLPLDPVATPTRHRRHGSPQAGISLAAATEIRGRPIRDAVAVLTKGLFHEKLNEAFSQTFSFGPEITPSLDSLPARIAWNLVLIYLTARSSGLFLSRCNFQQAEVWFRGNESLPSAWLSAQISTESLWEAEQLLNSVQFDSEFRALLPYIFEEHGPGSRTSVMKDPATASARAAKRETGTFYTPGDVADYMVEHTRQIYRGNFLTAKILDPACGTGVFFLALLRATIRNHSAGQDFSKFDYITNCLHGLDISGHALDAAAFVLLQECLPELIIRDLCPLTAWRSIRRNLIEVDALRVGGIIRNNARISTELFGCPIRCLTQFFPHASEGFDILIGNPPYAAIGERQDLSFMASRFASLNGPKPSQRGNLYTLFIEMMWQFTKPSCSAATLVTPLSIAYHGGSQYENCRHAMSRNGGRWQFAFFDREPHALFGEEVKTRNAILFRYENSETPKRGESANIETGPLRKWTSRTRANLFQNIDFTAVDSIEITAGIPKLDGAFQAEAFMKLKRRFDRFPTLATRLGTCLPAEALIDNGSPKVFVGGTAYNFLNVYRPIGLLPDEHKIPLSESPVHCLEFKSEAEASVAFAILSSRLTFWLWHVLGDGFHVAGWLFRAIPFAKNSFDIGGFDSLSCHGLELWRKLQNHRFTSVNGSRQTIGFRPLACNTERDAIDLILVRAAGLKNEFVAELRTFVHRNAIVDLADERRNHVGKHFIENPKE